MRSAENGGVYGLAGSAASFLTAAAAREGAGPLVMVLPDGEAASTNALDVRFYLGEEEEFRYPLTDKVIRYPSSDVLPYSAAGLETDPWIGRMVSLYRLVNSEPPRVIAVGLDALIRKILPGQVFARSAVSLSVGGEIDRETLLEQLVQAGYNRVPLVEDAGDFSVRGFIIDIYSPLYPYPVRIEQMGDRIESIRFFDPTNQRSRDDVSEISVAPVHMVIPDECAREQGLQRLLEACEDRGTEKRVRQSLVDDFRHKVRFPGAEFYLPYFFQTMETLFDYLPPNSTLLLPNQDILGRAFEDLEEEIIRGWESASEEGSPVPKPQDLYILQDDFYRFVQRFRNITISPLEVEKPGQVSFRVECLSNEDIRPELLRAKAYDAGMAGLVKRLETWRDEGNEIFLVSHTQGQAHRLLKLLEPYGLKVDFRGAGFDPSHFTTDPTPGIRLYIGAVSGGFRMKQARRIVLCEEEIFGSRVRAAPKKRARGTLISSLTDLAEGEPVVHEDYGIGIYRGLARKEFDGIVGEVMVIEYSGGDLLYHPVERLQVIQKYIAGSEEPPRIDKLGGKGWINTKAKVKKSIREMAGELLQIYARRQVSKRTPYSPPDENFATFEAAFEFEETPDQARAIQ
ncbi:MAG: hypothetical protein HY912_06940, partial [Desulfomonile tiedjei]|nr:hypothetical protein [Desulfomonile tiedjei]